MASGRAEAQTSLAVEDASLADVAQALSGGKITASALARAYLARIEAYDRGGQGTGPGLNSVRELNPDALPIAAKLDGVKPSARQPLAGVPILVKDNIATGDKQHTTAGSLALENARAKDDATVVKRLRAAGAVILGKANLTEFANIIAVEMPSGYSSLGGQVKNPYSPSLLDDRGIPLVLPGGSSAGSAVAVAAGLCAAAIGTETSGSLLSPATQNGVVTVKPTVGLISRAGILPISHSQDTAGPLTRTVRDSAILLNVLAARDPLDPATQHLQRPTDYTTGLDKDGLKGARIGVPSDPDDPLNDCLHGQAAGALQGGDGQGHRGPAGLRRHHRAGQHADGGLDRRARHDHGRAEPQSARPEQGPAGAAADRVPLRAQARSQSLSARLGDGRQGQDHGRHHRLQPGQRRQGAALRPGPLPRRPGHARRPVGAGISNRRGPWICSPPRSAGSMPI